MGDSRFAADGQGRIMLVEDDLALASELKSALERQGYDLLVVDKGATAQAAAERFRPDLVLLDVMMPGVDGWEVLARLRANVLTEGIPVIMLTAADSDTAKVKGFSLGADDYVTKPFVLQELRLRIAAVLRRTSRAPLADEAASIAVVTTRPGFELLRPSEVYFVQGFRNYTHVHTFDSQFLCRFALSELEDRHIESFMRVQRSFIVNMDHVQGCGWASKSSYQLRLADLPRTEITVSRPLVREVQARLGVRA